MLAFYAFIFITIKWIEKKVFYRFVFMLISILFIQSIFIFEKHKLQSTNELIVFNQSKKSIIGNREGAHFMLNSSDSLSLNDYALKPYLISTGIGDKFQAIKTKNVYKFKNEIILVVDSLGVYEFKSIKPSIIILQESPKINLERMLKALQPKLLIADGSNYKSFVAKWEQTCLKNKTPFYSTMQKGAFILK